MNVLVTGGCGYKGAVLVPKLLAAGHRVRVVDTQWFGRNLPNHPALEVLQADIRDVAWPLDGIESVIHLAGIANDPCGELDAKLTWEVNVLATMRLAEACNAAGVGRFIFASSASVYGIQGDRAVTEDSPMAPVSDYNKTKQVAERVLMSYSAYRNGDAMNGPWIDKPWSHANGFDLTIIRPATVCGVSPRMRLDVVVNMLASQALVQGRMTAHCGEHGGELMRPNVHIEDITSLYAWLLEHPEVTGTYNAGFENLSVGETARLVAAKVPAAIEVTKVPDKRSYRVDSAKLLAAGFAPAHTVEDAIGDIARAWHERKFSIADRHYNLRWMRKQGLVQEPPAPPKRTRG